MGLETIALASLALGAVGTGLNFYGQQQAAASQEQFALLNAQANLESTNMQSRLAMARAQMEQTQANLERSTQEINAQAIRGEADAKTRAAVANAARERQDQEEWNARLRAKFAKSGAIDTTGSPLALLEQAAEREHMAIAEGMYQGELERRQLFYNARETDRGATFAGIQGNLRYLEGLGQASAFRAQGYQGTLDSMGTVATARASRSAAVGGLIGGIAGLGSQTYDFYRQGAFRGFGWGAKPTV